MDERKRVPKEVQRLFWDVKKGEVDTEVHRSYIIRRVMDFGNMADVKWMEETYSTERIVEVVKKSKGLSRKSAYFWAAFYNIAVEEIACLKAS